MPAVVLEDPPSAKFLAHLERTAYLAQWTAMKRLAGSGRPTGEVARDLADVRLPSGERLGDKRDAVALRFLARCLADLDPAVLSPVLEGEWFGDFDPLAAAGHFAGELHVVGRRLTFSTSAHLRAQNSAYSGRANSVSINFSRFFGSRSVRNRSASAGLGNVGPTDPLVFPSLKASLKDADPVVRGEVVLALVKLGPAAQDAVPTLTELRDRDRDAKVRAYAGKALEKIRGKE